MRSTKIHLETRADYLAHALTVAGGHLFIGGGGWFLHSAPGATLRGYDLSVMKARCAGAGLPVIDILQGDHKLPIRLPSTLPMIAVGRPSDQQPWCSASYAPLEHVAAVYRAAGAEVINIPKRTAPILPPWSAGAIVTS